MEHSIHCFFPLHSRKSNPKCPWQSKHLMQHDVNQPKTMSLGDTNYDSYWVGASECWLFQQQHNHIVCKWGTITSHFELDFKINMAELTNVNSKKNVGPDSITGELLERYASTFDQQKVNLWPTKSFQPLTNKESKGFSKNIGRFPRKPPVNNTIFVVYKRYCGSVAKGDFDLTFFRWCKNPKNNQIAKRYRTIHACNK